MFNIKKRRSKRLRKKLHIAEFKEMGFNISFTFKDNISNEDFEMFIFEKFIEFIENNNLQYGGSKEGFVCRIKGSATESDRYKVKQFLTNSNEIEKFEICELTDVWYGPFHH